MFIDYRILFKLRCYDKKGKDNCEKCLTGGIVCWANVAECLKFHYIYLLHCKLKDFFFGFSGGLPLKMQGFHQRWLQFRFIMELNKYV